MLKAHHRYYNLQLKKIVTVRGEEKDGKVFVSYDGNLEYVDARGLVVPSVYDEIRALTDKEMGCFLEAVSKHSYDYDVALAIAKCYGEFNLPTLQAHSAFYGPNGGRVSLNDALANLELTCDQRGYCG